MLIFDVFYNTPICHSWTYLSLHLFIWEKVSNVVYILYVNRLKELTICTSLDIQEAINDTLIEVTEVANPSKTSILLYTKETIRNGLSAIRFQDTTNGLGITGVMKTVPTAALKNSLNNPKIYQHYWFNSTASYQNKKIIPFSF